MMNYKNFKEEVLNRFMDFMPEEFLGMEVVPLTAKKVNATLDGFTLKDVAHTPPRYTVTPTLYINDLYEKYTKTDNLEEVLTSAAKTMAKGMKEAEHLIPPLDMANVPDNIVFELINTEQNKGLLEDSPHRQFEDLSIIYRWLIKVDETGTQSIVIHNELATRLNLNEEQMYELATKNTKRLLPPTIMTMTDVVRDMLAKDGMPQEMIEEFTEDNLPMWVITNRYKMKGAIGMLYTDELYKIAEKLDSDLYILPSSLHEVIAVSVYMGNPNELVQMVSEINEGMVSPEDRLSNQVYYFNKDLKELSLATDTLNMKFD